MGEIQKMADDLGDLSKFAKREATVAFAGQDLSTLREYMEGIAGSWNGSDEKFSFEGEVFHEDDAGSATEIVEKIDELQEMLNNF